MANGRGLLSLVVFAVRALFFYACFSLGSERTWYTNNVGETRMRHSWEFLTPLRVIFCRGNLYAFLQCRNNTRIWNSTSWGERSIYHPLSIPCLPMAWCWNISRHDIHECIVLPCTPELLRPNHQKVYGEWRTPFLLVKSTKYNIPVKHLI